MILAVAITTTLSGIDYVVRWSRKARAARTNLKR